MKIVQELEGQLVDILYVRLETERCETVLV